MDIASLILGILSAIGFLIGLIPCFGWFNWLNIPLSIGTIIVSAIALNYPGLKKEMVVFGLVSGIVAVVFGALRLILGLGVF